MKENIIEVNFATVLMPTKFLKFFPRLRYVNLSKEIEQIDYMTYNDIASSLVVVHKDRTVGVFSEVVYVEYIPQAYTDKRNGG